jgi:hypothetical protein
MGESDWHSRVCHDWANRQAGAAILSPPRAFGKSCSGCSSSLAHTWIIRVLRTWLVCLGDLRQAQDKSPAAPPPPASPKKVRRFI